LVGLLPASNAGSVPNTSKQRTTGGAWLVTSVIMVLLVVGSAESAQAADTWSEPYPGVEYLQRTTSVPQRIHAVRVDVSRKDIRLRATRPADRGRTTSSLARAYGCEIAINGDFFGAGFVTTGLAIGGGERWADTTDKSYQGFVAAGRDNQVTIPPINRVIDPEPWMAEAVGGRPVIVRGGNVVDHTDCNLCGRHPRTAVGISEDGRTLILAVVDGRQPGVSAGATLNELGALMRELGAHRALNLDGGGSSTFYLAAHDGVVNRPSDGAERVVANHLAVCQVDPVGQLTGFVREGDMFDIDRPVEGAQVTLSTGQNALSDGSGRYTIDGVPAGDVTMTARAGDLVGTREIYVAAGDTTWGSVALQHSPAVPDAGPGIPGGPDAGDPLPGLGDAGVGASGGHDPAIGGCAAAGDSQPPSLVLALALAFAVVHSSRHRRRRSRL
jgi:hypothetical protein